MSIDIHAERMIPFTEAPEHIPGRPSLATVHRWRLRGARGARLESVLVGGKRFTSAEAIQRFIEATTRGAEGDDVPRLETNKARAKRLERVDAELAAAGF